MKVEGTQKGFTLLELVIVFIIIGVGAFSAAYGFSKLSDYVMFTRTKSKLVSMLEECTALYFQKSNECKISYDKGVLTMKSGGRVIRNEKPETWFSHFGRKERLKIKIQDASVGTSQQLGSFDASSFHLCLGDYNEKIIISLYGRIRFEKNKANCG